MRLVHPLGRAGEDLAARYLEKLSWRIVERNWHCRFGEIDIIAEKGETLGFFEVKLRQTDDFGGTSESITPAKLMRLQKAIEWYLTLNPTERPIVVDAILIQKQDKIDIKHIHDIIETD